MPLYGSPMLSSIDVDLIVADQLSDLRFDLREVLLGPLQPRAGGRPDVQAHLPGIHLRKEIPSQQREEQHRHRPSIRRMPLPSGAACRERPGQRIAVAFAKALEAAFEPRLKPHQTDSCERGVLAERPCAGCGVEFVHGAPHQMIEQHRHHRERQRQTRQQRSDHGRATAARTDISPCPAAGTRARRRCRCRAWTKTWVSRPRWRRPRSTDAAVRASRRGARCFR